MRGREIKYSPLGNGEGEGNESKKVNDIKTWMWLPGLVVVVVLVCVVMALQFSMPVAETLLALTMAFILSLLAIQATGATGKASFI